MWPALIGGALGAGAGLLGGWALDKAVGDGTYTASEAAADAVFGALGMGVMKGATKVAGGMKYASTAKHVDSAEDVATMMTTGFAVSTRGAMETTAVVVGSQAIEAALSSENGVKAGDKAADALITGALTAATVGFVTQELVKDSVKARISGKSWCRRHKQYDYCR